MKPGVLLCSGGIDSTVMLYWMVRHHKVKPHVLFCDYRQASDGRQIELLSFHTKRLGVEFYIDLMDWPGYARGKGHIFVPNSYPEPMTDAYAPVRMTTEEYEDYLDNQWDFIQGRNIIFLTRACAFAISRDYDTVYTAFQFDEPEWETMPEDDEAYGSDTSPAFVRAFNTLGRRGGFSKTVTVKAPFLDTRMTKQQIVRLGHMLAVPFKLTYSCEFFPECGNCHQCLIRKDVLSQRPVFR